MASKKWEDFELEINKQPNNGFRPRTLDMYNKKITKFKRLNSFLSDYADPDTTSKTIQKYFNLIILNGGFFDINYFNLAKVCTDLYAERIPLQFAHGLFAIREEQDFLDILKYFGITPENVHTYTFSYVVSAGIINEVHGKYNEELIDKVSKLVDDIKFLNSETLLRLIDSGEKLINLQK